MINKLGRKKKTTPSFWWDHDHNRKAIVVESDDDDYPVIDIFYFTHLGHDDDDLAIVEAENLISDLDAGRRDYRRVARVNGGIK